jgi:site-specific DNA recombinase
LTRAQTPLVAFDNADLMLKRRVIDLFCTVTLLPHTRGKKAFDPGTVKVVPKVRASSEGETTQ